MIYNFWWKIINFGVHINIIRKYAHKWDQFSCIKRYVPQIRKSLYKLLTNSKILFAFSVVVVVVLKSKWWNLLMQVKFNYCVCVTLSSLEKFKYFVVCLLKLIFFCLLLLLQMAFANIQIFFFCFFLRFSLIALVFRFLYTSLNLYVVSPSSW